MFGVEKAKHKLYVLKLENPLNSLLPSPFLPGRAQMALAAGIVG